MFNQNRRIQSLTAMITAIRLLYVVKNRHKNNTASMPRRQCWPGMTITLTHRLSRVIAACNADIGNFSIPVQRQQPQEAIH
jgi:hypothetical protein